MTATDIVTLGESNSAQKMVLLCVTLSLQPKAYMVIVVYLTTLFQQLGLHSVE
jgi:hypothetical protein